MQLKANDVRLNWLGAVSLRIDDNGVKPWRIPHGIRGLFDPQLQLRAAMPAGVRLSFFSDTRTIEGQIEATAENNQIDLYCNGDYIATQGLQNTNQFQFRDLPAEQKLVELWLPQKGTFQLRSIGLSDLTVIVLAGSLTVVRLRSVQPLNHPVIPGRRL